MRKKYCGKTERITKKIVTLKTYIDKDSCNVT